MQSRIATICAILTLILASPVNALQLESSARLDTEYSDNIYRASKDKDDDVLRGLELDIAFKEEGKRLQADGSINIRDEFYFNDSYEDNTSITTGFGLVNFGLVESFLDWQSSFTREETRRDQSELENPDNREFRDTFRTGPSFRYKISNAAILSAGSQYVNVENSNEDISDSKRSDSNLGLLYSVNEGFDVFVNSRYEVVIDGDGEDEYHRVTNSLGLTRQIAKGLVRIEYGKTKIDPELDPREDARYANIRFEKDDVFEHKVILTYQEDISDTTIGFDFDEVQERQAEGNLDAVEQDDILKTRRYKLGLIRDLGGVIYDLEGYFTKQDYRILENNEETKGAMLSLTWAVTSSLNAGFSYQYEINEFLDAPEDGRDRRHTYGLTSGYQFTKRLSFDALLQFDSRYNNSNSLREFEELSLNLGVKWKLL